MKGPILVLTLLFICLGLASSPALAQNHFSTPTRRIPFVRAGLYFGRTGIAQGPGAYIEVNPLRWLGFCAIVSRSHTTHDVDDGRVGVSDFSAGGCVTTHLPEIKGFLISPFVQMAFQQEHDRFSMLLDDGTTYREGRDGKHRTWLVGPMIDRAITKNGPRWALRIARDFGGGPAAKNAGGLYVVGGFIFPLDHPRELGRSFRRLASWKKSQADSASVNP